jgi:hypothetical protein
MHTFATPPKLAVGGDGYWSDRAALVNITGVDFNGYTVNLYFDESWDVERDGLIYTDETFMRNAQDLFLSLGLGDDFDYSEQGMQGDDYVNFDVGNFTKFAGIWNRFTRINN